MKPDNFDNSPWKPLLTTKPHAIVLLEDSLGTFTDDYDQTQYDYTDFLPLLSLPPTTSKPEGLSKSQRSTHNQRVAKLRRMGNTRGRTDNRIRFRHPYETEILQLKYPASIYQKADPIAYLPVETTSATFVDTFEGVLDMLKELKAAKEIAIDLEHHDARSYVGLTSLMQISTRERDWIVDTLKPWRQDLEILNEVFADPNIIKVTLIQFLAHDPRSDGPGISWRVHGHCMAAARPWSLCCWPLRHTSCKQSVEVRRRKSSLLAEEVHQLRRRQEVPNGRLEA